MLTPQPILNNMLEFNLPTSLFAEEEIVKDFQFEIPIDKEESTGSERQDFLSVIKSFDEDKQWLRSHETDAEPLSSITQYEKIYSPRDPSTLSQAYSGNAR